IDEAKANGKAWVVLGGHGYEPSATTELMEELVDYANGLGFKWVNTQEGMQAMGNIAQFGESMPRTIEHNDAGTRIGADGTIISNVIGKVRRLGDFGEFNFHTPITEFPEDTIT